MPARFYAPAAEREGDLVELPDDEGQHLARVLRLKAGASVRVFNGRGGEFDAIVDQVGRRSVRVRVDGARVARREPRVAVTLAQAVLKADAMDAVVRDAVMMGVAAIQPIVTARTEIALATLRRSSRVERWQRIAVSSAKQCGRATVPAVLEPRPFDEIPGALSTLTLPGPGLMFVEPSADVGTVGLADLEATPPREATLLVGPEGGWTPGEIEAASAVCRLIQLGSLTLRADAMAVVALAALLTVWREV